MKKEDKYHFFIQSAIIAANKKPKYRYFVDTDRNKLVRKVGDFKCDNTLLELPKISFKDKLFFLESFFESFNQEEGIKSLYQNFNECSEMDFKESLKKINIDLAVKYDFSLATFQYNYIEKLYKNLDLDQNMEIEW